MLLIWYGLGNEHNAYKISPIFKWVMYFYKKNQLSILLNQLFFRDDGSWKKEIRVSVLRPFYLLKYTSPCQQVRGMRIKSEKVKFDDEDRNNANSMSGNTLRESAGGINGWNGWNGLILVLLSAMINHYVIDEINVNKLLFIYRILPTSFKYQHSTPKGV